MLHARGGFVIEASCEAGIPEKAVITSTLGNKLVIRNIWGKCAALVNRKSIGSFEGALIELKTAPGDRIELAASS
jgi:hypothetical protein